MANIYCVGNWKMNKSPSEAAEFCLELEKKARQDEKTHLVVLPPAISSQSVAHALKPTSLRWGGQNCYFESHGAFTGETSPVVLKDLGATFCLVGHSERRQIFSEGDELLAKKLHSLQVLGVTPILCVGETLDDRKWNRTEEVVLRQLQNGLSQLESSKSFWIAYEPVWAIGTGQVATGEQVQEVHAMIRKFLQDNYGENGNGAVILYGGSVKPDNANWLAKIANVDGFLIGGASLKVDDFLQIYRQARG